MSAEQGQDGRAPGSVPNAFGNVLAWKWAPAMPLKVRRSILTLLYALRAMSNAAGELRFSGDRKPIRIQDIARAAGADEKDCRRYMRAAVAAGIVAVKGEQKRGKPTLYVLVLTPWPNWQAAEAVLNESRRKPGKQSAPWKDTEGSSGDRDRNQFGGPRPELETRETEEVQGTAPPMSSGDRDPNGSGDRAPNNPGRAKELPQEPVEDSYPPQVDHGLGRKDDHPAPGKDDHAARPAAVVGEWIRCADCGERLIPLPGRPRDRCRDCQTSTERKTA